MDLKANMACILLFGHLDTIKIDPYVEIGGWGGSFHSAFSYIINIEAMVI